MWFEQNYEKNIFIFAVFPNSKFDILKWDKNFNKYIICRTKILDLHQIWKLKGTIWTL